jgi:mRNA interferase MazF
VRRGEIWIAAAGSDYASKPRPAVIVQDDSFDATASLIVCILTSDPTESDLARLPIEPSAMNGLRSPSKLMVDKIGAIPKSKLGKCVGRLSDDDMARLNRAMMVFLGLASRRMT